MEREYRLIYSLEIELEPPPGARPGESSAIIVPLDRQGMPLGGGSKGRPRAPKVRTIDLRAGDDLMFERRWRRVLGVSAFRDAWLTAESVERIEHGMGYLYRPQRE
jgi:hypothetical protein